jgi:hypothetical protein
MGSTCKGNKKEKLVRIEEIYESSIRVGLMFGVYFSAMAK